MTFIFWDSELVLLWSFGALLIMQRQIFMTTTIVKRECSDDNSWQIDYAVADDDSYGSNVDTIDNARSLGNYHQYGNSDDSDIDDDDADVDDVGNLVDYHQR